MIGTIRSNDTGVTDRTRIFGIGLNKTGTSSLKQALEILGFGPAVPQRAVARAGLVDDVLVKGEYERALAWAEDYRVFEDRPWNVHDMYRRLDERFPDARFVLTVRDEASWWRSLERWVTVVKPKMQPRYLAHLAIAALDRNAAIESFRRYNAEVVSYFRSTDPSRLLVIDIAAGTAWDPLCRFLERPCPETAFPHANRQVTATGLPATGRNASRSKGATRSSWTAASIAKSSIDARRQKTGRRSPTRSSVGTGSWRAAGPSDAPGGWLAVRAGRGRWAAGCSVSASRSRASESRTSASSAASSTPWAPPPDCSTTAASRRA